jgi:hypothetical protein
MAGAVVSLTYQAQVDDLRKKLSSIPDITAAEARKAVRELDKAIKASSRAASSAGDAGAKAAKSAAAASKEVRDGLLELGDLAGIPKDRIDKLSKGMAALSSPIGLAVAGVGALAVGLGAAAVGAVKLVREAAAVGPALEPFRELTGFGGLSPSAVSSLSAAGAALDAVATVGRRVVEVLGADLAPTVERAALVVVQLGLALVDSANAAADGQGIFRALADQLGVAFVRSAFRVADVLTRLVGGLGDLAAAAGLGSVGDALRSVRSGFEGVTESAGKALSSAALGGFGATLERIEIGTADYAGRARELVAVQGQVSSSAEKQATATGKAAAATDEAAAAAKRAAAEYRAAEAARRGQIAVEGLALQVIEEQARLTGTEADKIAAIDARAQAEKAAVDEQVRDLTKLGQGEEARRLADQRYAQIAIQKEQELQGVQAETAAQADQARQKAKAATAALVADVVGVTSAAAQAAAAIGDLAAQRAQRQIEEVRAARERLGEDITEAEERQLEKREKAAEKAAQRAFRIQQGAAIATAAVQGAQAVISALATLGPIAGPIAAGLLSTAIAAQVALIASAPPPKFAAGGIVEAQSYDGRLIEAEPGEGVLTRRGVRAVGGEAGVAAANRGDVSAGGTGPLVVAFPSMARYLAVEAARPSAFGRAVRGRTPATGRR